MTIRLKLYGGLGNQMFQFATGFTIAKRKNTKLSLDLSYINQRQLFNGFELDKVFNIFSKVVFLNKPLSIKSISLEEILIKFDKTFYNFKEPHFHYTPKILNIPNHSFLDGYWQSELYFNEYEKEIKELFTFSNISDEKNHSIALDINKSNSVSIHIRRGDFLLNRNDNHNIDLKEYYLNAIKKTYEYVKDPKFFIFTDDPDWVLKNFILDQPSHVVNINHGTKSFIDMYLMSLCKINIIANSSFSWWSAWLNSKKNKIVFAPKYWFKDKSICTKNLIPNTWKIL